MTSESENTKNWGLTHFKREHRDLSESGKLEEAYLWGGKPVQRGRERVTSRLQIHFNGSFLVFNPSYFTSSATSVERAQIA